MPPPCGAMIAVLFTATLVARTLSVTWTGAPMRKRRTQSVPSLLAALVYSSVLKS